MYFYYAGGRKVAASPTRSGPPGARLTPHPAQARTASNAAFSAAPCV